MIECLAALPELRHPLVVGEPGGDVSRALRAAGAAPHDWLRSAADSANAPPPRPWPDGDGFDAALVRLPKSKEALTLALHAAASRMLPGGVMAVFGANAEGVRSVAKQLAPFADGIETLGTRHHARVVAGRRKPMIDGLKGHLADWRRQSRIAIGGTLRPWISYPGTFAGGGLDAGTALLIRQPLQLPPQARVLDFAAGTGVIAAAMEGLSPGLTIAMIEADAIALAAAQENVPGAQAMVGTSLAAAGQQRYDLIISNPPIHDGVAESHRVLERLIAEAPAYLTPAGALMLVVQRRVAVLPLLEKAFGAARILADDGRFTVARAERGARGR
jgi:16S rRNA (guanine1207-N2)-methyltransferase